MDTNPSTKERPTRAKPVTWSREQKVVLTRIIRVDDGGQLDKDLKTSASNKSFQMKVWDVFKAKCDFFVLIFFAKNTKIFYNYFYVY